jgi:hypothetical protein
MAATPVDDIASAPSGRVICGGRLPPAPAWAASVGLRTWTEIPNTNFKTWAAANVPAGSYFGTAPIDAMINAYGCSARNGNLTYINNGGHGDGTCNAVIECNLDTFGYRLVGQPTPPSEYPSGYVSAFSGGPLDWTYPSGKAPKGFFLPLSQLPDPADASDAVTHLARISTHMYASAEARGTKTHCFYRVYSEFDAATGLWSGNSVDIGAQLYAKATKYGNAFLDQGTACVYDRVTDKFFVTMVDGGWRNGIFVFDPVTRTIDTVHDNPFGIINPSSCMVMVGRKIYIFNKVAATYLDPQAMNQGVIFDMDAKTYQKFTISGDTSRTIYNDDTTQETIPCWYDGSKIHRWNYNAANRAYIMSLSLTPTSGDGTSGSPFVLPQTEALMSGSAPAPLYVYKRTFFHVEANCMCVLPVANSNWWALRMS